jgi:hypothetical protein
LGDHDIPTHYRWNVSLHGSDFTMSRGIAYAFR